MPPATIDRMYTPKPFVEHDEHKLFGIIFDYPLATLITHSSQGLCADHIPLRMRNDAQAGLVLEGHIALANPLWQSELNGEALAVFHGPQAYISPNGYATKKEHGKVVPTWNYITVHAHGKLRFLHDAPWKRRFLNDMTRDLEHHQQTPWAISDAPEAYTQKLLENIVGLELAVGKLHGKWKVSQNQPEQNRDSVRDALLAIGHPDAEVLTGGKDSKTI